MVKVSPTLLLVSLLLIECLSVAAFLVVKSITSNVASAVTYKERSDLNNRLGQKIKHCEIKV
uniref:Uncharacterized protein n=1 Tax=Romanomermis culicivorax TaxID=13658 RepID=A0A915IFE0_ROMCU